MRHVAPLFSGPLATSLLLLACHHTASAETITLPSIQDAYITYAEPDRSFGDAAEMRIGIGRSLVIEERALIQFDVSSLPRNAIIHVATLEAWYEGCPAENCDAMTSAAHNVTVRWDEASATWHSMLSSYDRGLYYDSTTKIPGGREAVGRWVAWNVTAHVQRWQNGQDSNNGLILTHVSAPHQNSKSFSSREAGADRAPRLLIDYYVLGEPRTATVTRTPSPTITPTPTRTPSPTRTASPTRAATATKVLTATQPPPTRRATATPRPTVTATPVPSRPLLLPYALR